MRTISCPTCLCKYFLTKYTHENIACKITCDTNTKCPAVNKCLRFDCRGPKYEQIACATMRLQDISSTVGTHDLVTLAANSSQTGILFTVRN